MYNLSPGLSLYHLLTYLSIHLLTEREGTTLCFDIHIYNENITIVKAINIFTSLSIYCFFMIKWQPTPVFLPGKSHG